MAGGVPFLAVHRAGVAADAGVEVDDEAELLRARHGRGSAGHRAVLRGVEAQHVRRRRSDRAAGAATAGCGSVSAAAGAQLSTRTRRSYQAAWPVIGSLLDWRAAVDRGQILGDHVVEQEALREFRRVVDRFQAPARLPIAFQVQTVSGLTPSISRTWHFTRPVRLIDPDPVVVFDAERRGGAAVHVEVVVGRRSAAARRSASPRNGTSPSAAG